MMVNWGTCAKTTEVKERLTTGGHAIHVTLAGKDGQQIQDVEEEVLVCGRHRCDQETICLGGRLYIERLLDHDVSEFAVELQWHDWLRHLVEIASKNASSVVHAVLVPFDALSIPRRRVKYLLKLSHALLRACNSKDALNVGSLLLEKQSNFRNNDWNITPDVLLPILARHRDGHAGILERPTQRGAKDDLFILAFLVQRSNFGEGGPPCLEAGLCRVLVIQRHGGRKLLLVFAASNFQACFSLSLRVVSSFRRSVACVIGRSAVDGYCKTKRKQR